MIRLARSLPHLRFSTSKSSFHCSSKTVSGYSRRANSCCCCCTIHPNNRKHRRSHAFSDSIYAGRRPLSIAAAEAFEPIKSSQSSAKRRGQTMPHLNANPSHRKQANLPTKEEVVNRRWQQAEIQRLSHIRNVGILAHVDAGKTTVTERMLAHAGIIHRPGSVDSGNTVTDFLPAERERGITIQSAAISFEWKWNNSPRLIGGSSNHSGNVKDHKGISDGAVEIHLIDTPGHVDFSVEVNRSVAVLDGAVLVIDAVAGVQAQTETVWRATTRPMGSSTMRKSADRELSHEPLPCLCLVNKMDKEGAQYSLAMNSIRKKLQGANPIPLHLPLFRKEGSDDGGGPARVGSPLSLLEHLFALPLSDTLTIAGANQFMGIVDLIQMRAIIWPDIANVSNIDQCIPITINLPQGKNGCPTIEESPITALAMKARGEIITILADVDQQIEEKFLLEEEPTNNELREAVRRATLKRAVLPIMAGAALRGKGVEPVLDAVADLLPSPLDRLPPALIEADTKYGPMSKVHPEGILNEDKIENASPNPTTKCNTFKLGHPLQNSLLAMAFKVIHLKGRGGSGDGRVVFARVYSGQLRARDSVKCITPSLPGEDISRPRIERVGGLLELAGGRFDNVEDGVCRSGDVCALVGLKTVVTGDTIQLASSNGSGDGGGKKRIKSVRNVYLAGVASPKPVLTVRLEVDTTEEQTRLSHALANVSIEDPSLVIEETESTTLMSGLGELHIEVTIDRLRREYGLFVRTGKPAVAYRETVVELIETNGLYNYDRTIGGTRLQAGVHLVLDPFRPDSGNALKNENNTATAVVDPLIVIAAEARQFLEVDDEIPEEELIFRSNVVGALMAGIKGSLRRGVHGAFALGNVKCTVLNVCAEGGLSALNALPGAARAAAATAVTSMLSSDRGKANSSVLEPIMNIEITLPGLMVGCILSDLSHRRGTIGDVIVGDVDNREHANAFIRADVPLSEILGYASSVRSLTGGEAAFTAEYKGHALCSATAVVR